MHFVFQRRTRLPMAVVLVGVLILVMTASTLAQQLGPASQLKLTPDKIAALNSEAAKMATARAAPQPPKRVSTAPNVKLVPTVPAHPEKQAGQGTIVESDFSIFLKTFPVENQWHEKMGANQLAVYAGATAKEPAQGLIAVVVTDHFGTVLQQNFYSTPTKDGPVRVVSAVGERLTLQSKSAATFTFDIPSRQFVSR